MVKGDYYGGRKTSWFTKKVELLCMIIAPIAFIVLVSYCIIKSQGEVVTIVGMDKNTNEVIVTYSYENGCYISKRTSLSRYYKYKVGDKVRLGDLL